MPASKSTQNISKQTKRPGLLLPPHLELTSDRLVKLTKQLERFTYLHLESLSKQLVQQIINCLPENITTLGVNLLDNSTLQFIYDRMLLLAENNRKIFIVYDPTTTPIYKALIAECNFNNFGLEMNEADFIKSTPFLITGSKKSFVKAESRASLTTTAPPPAKRRKKWKSAGPRPEQPALVSVADSPHTLFVSDLSAGQALASGILKKPLPRRLTS
jgi:hypothetical protein